MAILPQLLARDIRIILCAVLSVKSVFSAKSMATGTNIQTYHCLCAQLALATPRPLSAFASRSQDKSFILRQLEHVLQQRLETSEQPKMVRLHDGFEKRYVLECSRCRLPIAYHLDKAQFEPSSSSTGIETEILYILPGALQTTEELASSSDRAAESMPAG